MGIDSKNGKLNKPNGVCKKLGVFGKSKGNNSPIKNIGENSKSVINSGQAAAYASLSQNTSSVNTHSNSTSSAFSGFSNNSLNTTSSRIVELGNNQFLIAGSNGSVWLVEDFKIGHN